MKIPFKIMTEILKYSKKHLLRMPSVVFEVLTVEYAPIGTEYDVPHTV